MFVYSFLAVLLGCELVLQRLSGLAQMKLRQHQTFALYNVFCSFVLCLIKCEDSSYVEAYWVYLQEEGEAHVIILTNFFRGVAKNNMVSCCWILIAILIKYMYYKHFNKAYKMQYMSFFSKCHIFFNASFLLYLFLV